MQANHVAFSIDDQRDVAVLADGEFFLFYLAAGTRRSRCFNCAIRATEVDQNTVCARRKARHPNQGTWCARALCLHRKGPYVDFWTVELRKLNAKYALIKRLRATHVLHVDFEPANRVVAHRSPFRMRSD